MRSLVARCAPKWIQTELTKKSLWGYLPDKKSGEGIPQLALSFDLDYQKDSDCLNPLLDLLEEREVKSTLFSIGALVRQCPEPYRRAVEEGHEMGNHTETHPDNPVLNPDHEFWDLSVQEMIDEIGRCQDTLEELTGQRPTGFRSPHFKDAFRMMEALEHFPEINYVSTALASKCPEPTPYFPITKEDHGDLSLHYPAEEGWSQLMIPLTPAPGLRWSPFCSYSSIRRPSNPAKGAGLQTVAEWERSWGEMLKRERKREFASVYFDPMDVMRDDETRVAFRSMLERAVSEGWEITTLKSVESCWRGRLRNATGE